MPVSNTIALFGCRSPLIVHYLEPCLRRNQAVIGVSCSPQPRITANIEIIELEAYRQRTMRHPGLACAFAPRQRQALWRIVEQTGCRPATTIIDPTAILPQALRLGQGGFLNAGTVIGGECILGNGVVINRAASIGHHCLIGDFVSIGPGATLTGGIRVGSLAMIGAGATVLPNLRIDAGAVIAAGAVVRRHVSDHTLVAGHPARSLRYDVTQGVLNLPGEE